MFRVLRSLLPGEPRAAQALAQRLEVTSSDIVSAIDQARKFGVDIPMSLEGRYELPCTIDWLNAAAVEKALGEHGAHYRLEIVDEVVSTNDLVAREAERGVPGGLVIAAELQTGGRGRRGRRWWTGLGNALTFSVLFRFTNPRVVLSTASLVVGVALIRAMDELGARGLALKWPNDLTSTEGKVGGVLIETQGNSSGAPAIVVGVGLNVHLPAQIGASIDQLSSDLRSHGVLANRSAILGVTLRHLQEAMTQFDAEGFDRLGLEWTRHAAWLSRQVVLSHVGGENEHGVLLGVAGDGALLLATAKGQRRIYSGDLSLRAVDTDLEP